MNSPFRPFLPLPFSPTAGFSSSGPQHQPHHRGLQVPGEEPRAGGGGSPSPPGKTLEPREGDLEGGYVLSFCVKGKKTACLFPCAESEMRSCHCLHSKLGSPARSPARGTFPLLVLSSVVQLEVRQEGPRAFVVSLNGSHVHCTVHALADGSLLLQVGPTPPLLPHTATSCHLSVEAKGCRRLPRPLHRPRPRGWEPPAAGAPPPRPPHTAPLYFLAQTNRSTNCVHGHCAGTETGTQESTVSDEFSLYFTVICSAILNSTVLQCT